MTPKIQSNHSHWVWIWELLWAHSWGFSGLNVACLSTWLEKEITYQWKKKDFVLRHIPLCHAHGDMMQRNILQVLHPLHQVSLDWLNYFKHVGSKGEFWMVPQCHRPLTFNQAPFKTVRRPFHCKKLTENMQWFTSLRPAANRFKGMTA